jgi:hypothetical protein
MAVAADTVAGLFLALLIFFGYSAAFKDHKPLIMPSLLILPVLGVVLSFAARRTIRNSEGTRTGEVLANTAWWVSVVGGLGYATYLFAIEYSVRRDAAGELDKWVTYIIKPENEADFYRAFIKTVEPGRRPQLNPEDPKPIIAQFRDRVTAFKELDLVRIARRNVGQCEFVPGTLKDWVYRPFGIECVFTGYLKCPEGKFPLVVSLMGGEAPPGTGVPTGRQWAVLIPQQGVIDVEKILGTPYGWRVAELEASGTMFGREFIARSGAGPEMLPFVYQTMINETGDSQQWELIRLTTPVRWAVGSGLATAVPFSGNYAEYLKTRLLKLEDGSEPNADQKARFLEAWNTFGVFPPGKRIPGNDKLDVHPLVTLTDSAIEVRVPCEIPLAGKSGAARGRVVVVCKQPEIISELNKLRAEANPDQATNVQPNLTPLRVKWRVDRIESDMQEVEAGMQGRPGGPGMAPGGPGGMMPGGPGS